MISDRVPIGYEPRFDVDVERGKQGEMFVHGIIDALKNGGHRIEVKTDERSRETGNVYVEYECRKRGEYVKSGIATSEAQVWVFVLDQGNVALAISTERLRELARSAFRKGRIAEERDGSHPTRGALIRLPDLISAGTHAVRAPLAGRYSGTRREA